MRDGTGVNRQAAATADSLPDEIFGTISQNRLTVNPAERFGRSRSKGRVAKEMDADLVVLDGDPSEDIKAFSKVRYTIRGGKIIYPEHAGP